MLGRGLRVISFDFVVAPSFASLILLRTVLITNIVAATAKLTRPVRLVGALRTDVVVLVMLANTRGCNGARGQKAEHTEQAKLHNSGVE